MITVLILIAVFLFIISTTLMVAYNNTEKGISCTKEAKICPDGSIVGRQAPNCEFTPCPENEIVGDDKDEHGCIGSAGYIWCELKQKCIREWEEMCEN